MSDEQRVSGRRSRIVVRTMVLATVLGASIGWSGPATTARGQDRPDQVAHLLPEVRLRKLHLVRPDLIPYPIMYEVVC